MTDLAGKRIMVVEDDYLVAQDACDTLRAVGAEVIGPLPDVAQALDALDHEGAPDAAILDVNLHGQMVFPVADALDERGVPFLFLTGYDAASLPERYVGCPKLEKPVALQRLGAIVAPLIACTA